MHFSIKKCISRLTSAFVKHKLVSMNRLTTAERARILACLVEGSSIRATCRMTGFAKGTVLKFLAEIGSACAAHHDATVRGLKTERLQCDEIWSFCGAKRKNAPEHRKGEPGIGDVWTWTAIDADTKLMVSWLVADREGESARRLMWDVAGRVVSARVQISSDGHKHYPGAVKEAFGNTVDFGVVEKDYGPEDRSASARYSPLVCVACTRKSKQGNPDPKHISTSYVERANLHMRRFTRLTNGFSKKIDNHAAAIALHFAFYNWVRVHQTLRVTPAMAAGLTDHAWTLDELVALVEAEERAVIGTEANKRGPYRVKDSN